MVKFESLFIKLASKLIQSSFVLVLVSFFVLSTNAYSQEIGQQSETHKLFSDTQAENGASLISVQPRGSNPVEQQSNVERNVEQPDPGKNIENAFAVKPFGAQLFLKSNFSDKSLSVNGAYTIAAGDRIAIKMWGARTLETIYIVDVQGNLFIPEIGPIYVEGVKNTNLNKAVSARVSEVFTNNVKVYTNLLGAQPIGIYVAGGVKYPGQIPGARGDSILYFLSRAGGIEEERGSYRNISVRRKGKTVANVDLYEFMVNGDLPDFEFQDKDTIVVHTQLPSVSILGEVKNPFRYEFDPSSKSEQSLMALASPKGTASHVLIRGVRGGKFISQFVSLEQMGKTSLFAGDTLEVLSDQVTSDIVVKVIGNSGGLSTFSIPKSMLLGELANLIQIDPLVADIDSIFLRRKSVADSQKLAIEQSLYELQRNALTASSSSATGSIIRAKEAELIDRFVSKAKAVDPEGRVVLSGVDWSGVHLEQGDEIVIPQKTDLVFITGEVKVPQTILWGRGFNVENYIDAAGGLSNRGDGDRLVIIRLNGSVQNGSEPIQKGDHIMVLPNQDLKLFALFKDIIEIGYRVALSAAVVLNAND